MARRYYVGITSVLRRCGVSAPNLLRNGSFRQDIKSLAQEVDANLERTAGI